MEKVEVSQDCKCYFHTFSSAQNDFQQGMESVS